MLGRTAYQIFKRYIYLQTVFSDLNTYVTISFSYCKDKYLYLYSQTKSHKMYIQNEIKVSY